MICTGKRCRISHLVFAIAFLAGAAVPAAADLITVDFSGDTGLSSPQRAVIAGAADIWDSYLAGYQSGISVSGITISASGSALDGVNGILAGAAPGGLTTQGGYVLATTGIMVFDTADVENLRTSGRLEEVAAHEMGHVLGFGTLWVQNSVYTISSGQYTGTNALAAWRNEFSGQSSATSVPVELGGGAGTADSHWNENNGGGSDTGITDGSGRDMRYELMTGWANSPYFISQTTLAQFEDIGFVLVPEPTSLLLFGFGAVLVTVGVRRRRRRAA